MAHIFCFEARGARPVFFRCAPAAQKCKFPRHTGRKPYIFHGAPAETLVGPAQPFLREGIRGPAPGARGAEAWLAASCTPLALLSRKTVSPMTAPAERQRGTTQQHARLFTSVMLQPSGLQARMARSAQSIWGDVGWQERQAGRLMCKGRDAVGSYKKRRACICQNSQQASGKRGWATSRRNTLTQPHVGIQVGLPGAQVEQRRLPRGVRAEAAAGQRREPHAVRPGHDAGEAVAPAGIRGGVGDHHAVPQQLHAHACHARLAGMLLPGGAGLLGPPFQPPCNIGGSPCQTTWKKHGQWDAGQWGMHAPNTWTQLFSASCNPNNKPIGQLTMPSPRRRTQGCSLRARLHHPVTVAVLERHVTHAHACSESPSGGKGPAEGGCICSCMMPFPGQMLCCTSNMCARTLP